MPADVLDLAPGAIVIVRDEEWVISSIDNTADGPLLTVRGLSELVEGTTAQFYPSIDTVRPLDPAQTRVVTDSSSHYAQSRLWLESTLRKTALPIAHQELTTSQEALADALEYQREAVSKALDPKRLRTRLLIADAVGLGKTLEIGMILSELMRRGRGRRILVVTPRHVLEQMQHEMWTRFAIPFVRLDSEGVQQVKQKLPATRNPFTFFEKVIISIDTLKQDRFIHDLRQHHWDAVVIDESHNVTNQSTQNNQLAHILAPNTDALILASATPHNGRNESFAQLLSLLEPTSVTGKDGISKEAIPHLMIRRHRYSESVKNEVGDRWAQRLEPRNIAVDPSPEELAVGQEIAQTWTHPRGAAPMTGKGSKLFPWTLAKAFLSSPVALEYSINARLKSLEDHPAAERQALEYLQELNTACLPEGGQPRSGKYRELVRQLRDKGVSKASPARVVVFAERVQTLHWLRENITRDLKLKADQVAVLHGGLTDVEQQQIVESFKQSTSPIRVLVTGDVASEGVNLHKQCHELIHYDIPWSLIRIEQRNGRIDRYGQEHPPQITTLLLDLSQVEGFTGDIRVLSRLLEREQEAHQKLGDVASIMGEYSGKAEEDALIDVLRGAKDFATVVPSVTDVLENNDDDLAAFLAQVSAEATPSTAADGSGAMDVHGNSAREVTAGLGRTGLFASDVEYLLAGLTELYGEPGRETGHGGVGLQIERNNAQQIQAVSFVPRDDLAQRLIALPQSYLKERAVLDRLQLTPDRATAEARLSAALNDAAGSSWPDTHYLAPQHPVLEWLADRSLAHLGRGEVFAVHGGVTQPAVVMQGMVTNKRGQNIAVSYLLMEFMGEQAIPTPYPNAAELFADVGLNAQTVGIPVRDPRQYQRLIPKAVDVARDFMGGHVQEQAFREAQDRADAWVEKMDRWEQAAEEESGRSTLFRLTKSAVEAERRLSQEMRPDRTYVRPLLVVIPPEGQ